MDIVNIASVVVKPGKVWLKLNGFVIIGKSTIVITVPGIDVAALVVGFGVIWFEFNGLGEVNNSPFGISIAIVVGAPAIVVSDS